MQTLKNHVPHFSSIWLTLALVLFGFSLPGMAFLGGDVKSVQADQGHLKASIHVTQAEPYSVHEIEAPGGTTVKEYVSPQGRVFAVVWQGPFLPDLQQILGVYFQAYASALEAEKAKPFRRTPLNIRQPGLVVERGGHMRAQFGRAYVPILVPASVKLEEIK